MTLEQKIRNTIRDVKDFPREGIVFKDITPILSDALLCKEIVARLETQVKGESIDAIAGIESRGFFFGLALSMKMELPFIPIRKKGKLPFSTISAQYELEYGTSEIEMHTDAVRSGDNVLIHDDLLATGGTALAAAELVNGQGGNVAGFSFVIELEFLKGGKTLNSYSNNLWSLVKYQ